MEKRWTELQKTIRPDHLLDMCAAFSRDFPESKYGEALVSLQAGVGKAMSAIRAAQLTVDVIDETSGDNAHLSDLRSAMRGDKDSAYRIAAMYRRGSNGLAQDVRRGEQWLQVSAELGRGDASWELAEIYNRRGMVAEAARFEVMALESGFKPPPRLPSRDRNL